MKKSMFLLLLCSSLVNSAEIPTLLDSTKILHIPVLKYQGGGVTVYYEVDLKTSFDFGAFTPVYGKEVDAPSGSEEGESSTFSIEGISGNYDGVLSAYEPGTKIEVGPFSSCPPMPFSPGSTTSTIAVVENNIDISIDVFPDLVCMLTGTVGESSASGTFECNNFNDGTWASTLIGPLDNNAIIAINVSYLMLATVAHSTPASPE